MGRNNRNKRAHRQPSPAATATKSVKGAHRSSSDGGASRKDSASTAAAAAAAANQQALNEKSKLELIGKDYERTMEDDLSCAICQDVYINPMMLNCSHSFCKLCVVRWLSRQTGCPQCRTKVTFQAENLALKNVIDKMYRKATLKFQISHGKAVAMRMREEEDLDMESQLASIAKRQDSQPRTPRYRFTRPQEQGGIVNAAGDHDDTDDDEDDEDFREEFAVVEEDEEEEEEEEEESDDGYRGNNHAAIMDRLNTDYDVDPAEYALAAYFTNMNRAEHARRQGRPVPPPIGLPQARASEPSRVGPSAGIRPNRTVTQLILDEAEEDNEEEEEQESEVEEDDDEEDRHEDEEEADSYDNGDEDEDEDADFVPAEEVESSDVASSSLLDSSSDELASRDESESDEEEEARAGRRRPLRFSAQELANLGVRHRIVSDSSDLVSTSSSSDDDDDDQEEEDDEENDDDQVILRYSEDSTIEYPTTEDEWEWSRLD